MLHSVPEPVGRRKLARTNTARPVRLTRLVGLARVTRLVGLASLTRLVGLARLAARKGLGACCDLLQQLRL